MKQLATKFRAGLMAPAHFLKLAGLPSSFSEFWKTRLAADTDAAAARTGLGATTVGNALFTAANAGAARTAIGATTVGSNVITASNQANARTALGAGSVGSALFTADDTNTARGAIGADLLRGMRNKIINGTFEFAARGLNFSASAVSRYTLDRWFQDTSGSTMAVSRTTLGVGTAESLGGGATYCANITVVAGSGASDRARLLQRIENVRTLAGKKVTVSFCARANSGTPSMAVNFTQNFGTGGSPSAAVVATGQKIGLTANWQYFKLTFDIPSVSGKTVGTNDDDFLALDLWFDAGSTYNSQTGSLGHQSNQFFITKVQVAEGDLTAEADPFEERLAAVEQNLCERYFQLSLMWPAVWYNASNPASLTCGVTLPVTMRAAPTVTTHVNPAVLEPGVSNRNLVGLPTTTIGVKGGQLDFTTQTPSAAFKAGFVQPGSFKLDAEL